MHDDDTAECSHAVRCDFLSILRLPLIHWNRPSRRSDRRPPRFPDTRLLLQPHIRQLVVVPKRNRRPAERLGLLIDFTLAIRLCGSCEISRSWGIAVARGHHSLVGGGRFVIRVCRDAESDTKLVLDVGCLLGPNGTKAKSAK